MMKIIYTPFCLVLLAVVLALVSCDPMSSVEYKIYNMSTDTVAVSFYREVMSSSYQGYEITDLNDSVVSSLHAADSATVAIVEPNRCLKAHYEWGGLYREELIVPLWKYIISVTMGGVELAPESWNNASSWKVKTQGGGFGEGESRYYELWLRGKQTPSN